MKIVLAPNALKGSLTAEAAACAMERGVRRVLPEADVVRVPVADGGDGAGALLGNVLGAVRVDVTATGPLGARLTAPLYYNAAKRLAVFEMASVAGLALLTPDEYDPLHATTRGVGELIRAALDLGAERLIVGIGGSATTDGGGGMAHALGVRFYDAQGRALNPADGVLTEIQRVDMRGLDMRVRVFDIHVMCDVDNPLLGECGAARVYAPQKGATPAQVELLEAGLENLAAIIARDLSLDVRDVPGAGAAGGLGAGLMAFLGAKLSRGVDVILDALDFDTVLQGADLVLTAEGRADAQTAHGKAPAGVAARAKKHGVPCVLLAGSVADDAEVLREYGVTAVVSINPSSVSLPEAMDNAAHYLEVAAEKAVREFCAGSLR
jgi:glycerate kinase